MLKKLFAAIVAVLIFNMATVAFASGLPEKEAKLTEKVRTNILKLGTGPDAKVELKLKDGSKLKGYVKESDENQFVVVDPQGGETAVPYSNAQQVKGKNHIKGVYLVVGFTAALVILILIVLRGS